MKFLTIAIAMMHLMTGVYITKAPVIEVSKVDSYYEVAVDIAGHAMIFESYDSYTLGEQVDLVLNNNGTAAIEDDVILYAD